MLINGSSGSGIRDTYCCGSSGRTGGSGNGSGDQRKAAGCVMFVIGKSRRVFYVFLKAPIANHSDPNPLK